VRSVYIRAGAKAEIGVPLGSYTLKYSTGENWLGKECLFGVNTLYKKADTALEFSREGDSISGHSIELILQAGGNLSSSQIGAEDW